MGSILSAEVMQLEHAKQSANVILALSNFFEEPSENSSKYEPSLSIFILAPLVEETFLGISTGFIHSCEGVIKSSKSVNCTIPLNAILFIHFLTIFWLSNQFFLIHLDNLRRYLSVVY